MSKLSIILSTLFLSIAGMVAGCGSVNTLSGATKAVGAGYTSVGMAVAAQITCDQTAVALAKSGNLDAAQAALKVCGNLNKAEHIALTAINAAQVAIKAIGPGGTGYAAAVAPMQVALCQLNKAVNVADPKLPIVLCPAGG